MLPKSSRVGLEIPHEAWQPQLAPEHGLRSKLDLVWTLFLFCAFFSIKGYQKFKTSFLLRIAVQVKSK